MEHFFRHESGRLVSVLARLFSLQNLDLVEDVVQSALLEALRVWRTQGVPDNPTAWIRRVARNRIVDHLRHHRMASRHAVAWIAQAPGVALPDFDDLFLDSQIEDSQLRLMFACCHPALAEEDRIAITLRSLCGFHDAEIARAFIITEDAAKKRIQRAKKELGERDITLEVPGTGDLEPRLASVHRVLYLLFNEGYLSTLDDQAIRQDLCEEAVRLALILAEHATCGTPATHALTALMLFHAARFAARLDDAGRMILLEDQDRTQWDHDLIVLGRRWLDRASRGERISLYHLEAGIALEHCTAVDFTSTNWAAILRLYDAMIAAHPSPIYRLNRAITLAQADGPRAGLDALADPTLQHNLEQYHLLDAARGELHRRLGEHAAARKHFEAAMAKTRSEPERELLRRKLAMCECR